MTPPSAKDYAAAVVRAKFLKGRLRRALTPEEMDAIVSTAYDAGVLAQQRFASGGSMFDELAEKIKAAKDSGRERLAVCVSRDVWDRMRADKDAVRYVGFSRDAETVLTLPVEHVEGRNRLFVRVAK